MIKDVIHINSGYKKHTAFLNSIPSDFNKIGKRIYFKKRNDVKIIENEGVKFVVKSFIRITLLNRLIYVFFRKSKAQRAYENALKLEALGINSPKPVAYINCYNGVLLGKSYFVSLYVENITMRERIEKPLAESRDAIEELADFACNMHQKGVFHNDFNLDNLLCEPTSDGGISYI